MITGAGGQLGQRLGALLPEASRFTRAELDLASVDIVREAVAGHDVVINAAAWTDVDAAEAREAEATEINGHAVKHLALACANAGARLIHLSTDYVFDGTACSPYPEDASTDPVNAYGRGKLAGEHAALTAGATVVRTAWLYDNTGRNFVTTVLRLASERDTLDIVDDQHGQPTWAHTLAQQLVALVRADAPPGIYHGTCTGATTWYQFAREIFRLAGLDPRRIRPTTSDRFPRPAKRPTYSVLAHGNWAKAGLEPMPPWEVALREALAG